MSRTSIAAVALLVVSCASVGTPPPAVAPAGVARYLVDPRIGFKQTVPPALDRRFETAWGYFLAGDNTEATRRLDDIRQRNPEYTPAALAEAAIAIVQGNLDAAATIVRTAEQNAPAFVADRTKSLRDELYNELVTRAQNAPAAESTQLLRDALAINAQSIDARLQLASRLIAQRSFDEAMQILTPIATTPDADRPDVQAALAEIEAGRGDYQAAMMRYDRLARMTRDPRYAQRLNEIKEIWNEQNMPPQYQKAVESPAIDRSDFAVLLYWKVTAVRFAQNLATPPIAIDIENVPGREEIIRAMAIGLYDVDPVTRRVSPNRPVTASMLARLGARVLTIGGAPCARGATNALAACGITDPSANEPPDAPVTGKTAAAMLEQIEAVLPH